MASTEQFPAVDSVDPTEDTGFQGNTTSSQHEDNEHQPEEGVEKKVPKEEKNPAQNLKTTIIFSGFIVAVVGAIFAITKKLKEK